MDERIRFVIRLQDGESMAWHLARQLHAFRPRLRQLEEKSLQPLDNPFGPKVLPMS
jgi:hypothetical protein